MLFCLGVSLLVYLCVHLMLMLVLYGYFVCMCLFVRLFGMQKQNCFGVLTVFW
jgi:hypothetical protein